MLHAHLSFDDITWLDLRALVRHAKPDSAIGRATNPDWWVTPEVQFLRDVEYRLAWLMWAKTKDGDKGRNAPRPVPLTDAEKDAAKSESERYDAKTIDETLKFLGWEEHRLRRAREAG